RAVAGVARPRWLAGGRRYGGRRGGRAVRRQRGVAGRLADEAADQRFQIEQTGGRLVAGGPAVRCRLYCRRAGVRDGGGGGPPHAAGGLGNGRMVAFPVYFRALARDDWR